MASRWLKSQAQGLTLTWNELSADAMSGARAFTSASVEISGMTPHTIEVFVTATH